MRSKSYCVNLTPIPWKRAARNMNRTYDSQTKEKIAFGLYLNQQHNQEPLFDKAIKIHLTFYMAIPTSIKNRKNTHYHSTVPDLDNLIKLCLDTMTNILITDDRIICSLFAEKVYDKDPRTEIVITEV